MNTYYDYNYDYDHNYDYDLEKVFCPNPYDTITLMLQKRYWGYTVKRMTS